VAHPNLVPGLRRRQPASAASSARSSSFARLLAACGGADLQVVKERLGHGSIATTGKYLHTLPTADETALAALRRIRDAR